MKRKIKQQQNQRRRQQRESWELDKCNQTLKCDDERFDFDHCSDIKNHVSPLTTVEHKNGNA